MALSIRQLQVLKLIASGNKNAEAAHKLGIKSETVNTHAIALRKKLGAKTNAHAVAIAKDKGLI